MNQKTATHSAGAAEYTDSISAEGVRPPTNVLYDIKQSDGVAPILQIWGMWSTPSLLLLLGPLCSRVVTPVRVLSMGLKEQTVCANKWLRLNWDCYLAILETI